MERRLSRDNYINYMRKISTTTTPNQLRSIAEILYTHSISNNDNIDKNEYNNTNKNNSNGNLMSNSSQKSINSSYNNRVKNPYYKNSSIFNNGVRKNSVMFVNDKEYYDFYNEKNKNTNNNHSIKSLNQSCLSVKSKNNSNIKDVNNTNKQANNFINLVSCNKVNRQAVYSSNNKNNYNSEINNKSNNKINSLDNLFDFNNKNKNMNSVEPNRVASLDAIDYNKNRLDRLSCFKGSKTRRKKILKEAFNIFNNKYSYEGLSYGRALVDNYLIASVLVNNNKNYINDKGELDKERYEDDVDCLFKEIDSNIDSNNSNSNRSRLLHIGRNKRYNNKIIEDSKANSVLNSNSNSNNVLLISNNSSNSKLITSKLRHSRYVHSVKKVNLSFYYFVIEEYYRLNLNKEFLKVYYKSSQAYVILNDITKSILSCQRFIPSYNRLQNEIRLVMNRYMYEIQELIIRVAEEDLKMKMKRLMIDTTKQKQFKSSMINNINKYNDDENNKNKIKMTNINTINTNTHFNNINNILFNLNIKLNNINESFKNNNNSITKPNELKGDFIVFNNATRKYINEKEITAITKKNSSKGLLDLIFHIERESEKGDKLQYLKQQKTKIETKTNLSRLNLFSKKLIKEVNLNTSFDNKEFYSKDDKEIKNRQFKNKKGYAVSSNFNDYMKDYGFGDINSNMNSLNTDSGIIDKKKNKLTTFSSFVQNHSNSNSNSMLKLSHNEHDARKRKSSCFSPKEINEDNNNDGNYTNTNADAGTKKNEIFNNQSNSFNSIITKQHNSKNNSNNKEYLSLLKDNSNPAIVNMKKSSPSLKTTKGKFISFSTNENNDSNDKKHIKKENGTLPISASYKINNKENKDNNDTKNTKENDEIRNYIKPKTVKSTIIVSKFNVKRPKKSLIKKVTNKQINTLNSINPNKTITALNDNSNYNRYTNANTNNKIIIINNSKRLNSSSVSHISNTSKDSDISNNSNNYYLNKLEEILLYFDSMKTHILQNKHNIYRKRSIILKNDFFSTDSLLYHDNLYNKSPPPLSIEEKILKLNNPEFIININTKIKKLFNYNLILERERKKSDRRIYRKGTCFSNHPKNFSPLVIVNFIDDLKLLVNAKNDAFSEQRRNNMMRLVEETKKSCISFQEFKKAKIDIKKGRFEKKRKKKTDGEWCYNYNTKQDKDNRNKNSVVNNNNKIKGNNSVVGKILYNKNEIKVLEEYIKDRNSKTKHNKQYKSTNNNVHEDIKNKEFVIRNTNIKNNDDIKINVERFPSNNFFQSLQKTQFNNPIIVEEYSSLLNKYNLNFKNKDENNDINDDDIYKVNKNIDRVVSGRLNKKFNNNENNLIKAFKYELLLNPELETISSPNYLLTKGRFYINNGINGNIRNNGTSINRKINNWKINKGNMIGCCDTIRNNKEFKTVIRNNNNDNDNGKPNSLSHRITRNNYNNENTKVNKKVETRNKEELNSMSNENQYPNIKSYRNINQDSDNDNGEDSDININLNINMNSNIGNNSIHTNLNSKFNSLLDLKISSIIGKEDIKKKKTNKDIRDNIENNEKNAIAVRYWNNKKEIKSNISNNINSINNNINSNSDHTTSATRLPKKIFTLKIENYKNNNKPNKYITKPKSISKNTVIKRATNGVLDKINSSVNNNFNLINETSNNSLYYNTNSSVKKDDLIGNKKEFANKTTKTSVLNPSKSNCLIKTNLLINDHSETKHSSLLTTTNTSNTINTCNTNVKYSKRVSKITNSNSVIRQLFNSKSEHNKSNNLNTISYNRTIAETKTNFISAIKITNSFFPNLNINSINNNKIDNSNEDPYFNLNKTNKKLPLSSVLSNIINIKNENRKILNDES